MYTRVAQMMAASGEPLIQLVSDQTPLDEIDIWLAISSGSCTIDWGDGNTTTATGVLTKYSHDYTAAGTGTYHIVIYGQTKNITRLECTGEPISGDIAQFGMLANLTYLRFTSTSVSGDIAGLSGLTLLTYLSLNATPVSGDIANLSGLISLTSLLINNTSVSGDIANLSGLISLAYLRLYYTLVDTYTQGVLPDWEGASIQIRDLGLSVLEVSNFLIDLNNATGSPGNGNLGIHGTNAIPNAAGLTAKGLLEGKGWTVTVST